MRLNILGAHEAALCSHSVICRTTEETLHHVFLHCKFSWKIWMKALQYYGGRSIEMPMASTD
jgi:hypothetical protein